MNEDSPIIKVDDKFVTQSVFNRLFLDKANLESEIKKLCFEFLKKYPSFEFDGIQVFRIYCDMRCIVNLKLSE